MGKRIVRRSIPAVLKSLGLKDLRLLNATAKSPLATGKLPEKVGQTTTVGTRIEGQLVLIHIKFSLTATSDEAEDLFLIEAEYGVTFDVVPAGKFGDKDAQMLGQVNGVLIVWPYWREFVQSMTGRMSLPQLRIPLHLAGEIEFAGGNAPARIPAAKRGPKAAKKR